MPAVLDLLDRHDPMVALQDLCLLGVERVPVLGCVVTVMLANEPLGVLASAGRGVDELERRRIALPGPGTEANASGRFVDVGDLDEDGSRTGADAWPAYADDARRAGLRSIAAVPLRVGHAALGALVLGRAVAGVLDGRQRADAVTLADVAALLVLAVQARAFADGPARELRELTDQRAVVHQAAGMIAVQLDVDVASAHAALLARAWQLGQPTAAVARAVVARDIRLTDDA